MCQKIEIIFICNMCGVIEDTRNRNHIIFKRPEMKTETFELCINCYNNVVIAWENMLKPWAPK